MKGLGFNGPDNNIFIKMSHFPKKGREIKNGTDKKRPQPLILLQVSQDSSCQKLMITEPTLWKFQQDGILSYHPLAIAESLDIVECINRQDCPLYGPI